MNKKLIDIIYNPGDVCTLTPGDWDVGREAPGTGSANDAVSLVFELMAGVVGSLKDRPQLVDRLATLTKHLHLEIPLEVRPDVFLRLNELLRGIKFSCGKDRALYLLCFEMATIFKMQIDRAHQKTLALSDREWVELEKCVYLLCDWEDEVIYDKEAKDTFRFTLHS